MLVVDDSITIRKVTQRILERQVQGIMTNLRGTEVVLHLKAGIARANTGTGDISFTGSVQDLALRTVSGTLDITAPELRRGQFTTVDGDLAFTGAIPAAGVLDFETHSGDIDVRLPRSLSADVRLSTVRGTVEVGYPEGAPDADDEGRTLQLEVGGGGAEVAARSWSGSIRLHPIEAP